jgi:hypothetical protein
MDIGAFDQEKAKSKAKVFLEESIFVLSKMMDVDPSSIDVNSINPYNPQEPLYASWECLRSEISALKKLQ